MFLRMRDACIFSTKNFNNAPVWKKARILDYCSRNHLTRVPFRCYDLQVTFVGVLIILLNAAKRIRTKIALDSLRRPRSERKGKFYLLSECFLLFFLTKLKPDISLLLILTNKKCFKMTMTTFMILDLQHDRLAAKNNDMS